MSKPKVMLFGAEWCASCKSMKQVLESVADIEYIDIDSDVSAHLVKDHQIRGVPTYINTENGKRGVGLKSLEDAKYTLGL